MTYITEIVILKNNKKKNNKDVLVLLRLSSLGFVSHYSNKPPLDVNIS